MAASAVAAVMNKYKSFTFATSDQARIWFDEKPNTNGAPTSITPPYAVLEDKGTSFVYTFEYVPTETTKIDLTLYANSLADVDAMIDVVRFNGGTPQQRLGLDNTTSLVLTNGRYNISVSLSNIVRSLESQRGVTGSLVYKAVMSYEVEASYA